MDSIKRMLPKTWNDSFGALLALPIIGILTFYAEVLPEMVAGAFISVLTTIVIHYFRKAPPAGEA